MMGRANIAGRALISVVVATALLGVPVAHAGPASNPDAAYCHDMVTLGHPADCATLASYGHNVCGQFDKGTNWYSILTQLDAATRNQQFSADILAAAVQDLCPWNESKKP